MTLPTDVKSCLLITYGPVPTPEYQTIEGGGMRIWGLAKGLLANGVRVTIAVNQSFPQKTSEHEGVLLTNWELNDQFASLINSYDAVLMSYTMGDPSTFVVDHINQNVQLILDAYVPIYVEVSARNAVDMPSEMRHYMADLQRFNRTLQRGDYFLCASQSQKTFYIGVLSALGIINPHSYHDKRLIIAPFGIHDIPPTTSQNPYKKLGIKETDFTVMWFGGLYPWFRVEELLEAILQLSSRKNFKFVIVGGKNPFNTNPDFLKQYQKAQAFAESHKLLNTSLFFVDWVDFDTRIDWFRHADVVISLNQEGEENAFAWRTRVMDFVWGELAIITNGGDPLSDELIEHNAALHLQSLSASAIADALKNIHDNPKTIKNIKKNIVAIKPRYYWHTICKVIAPLITAGTLPYRDEQSYRQSHQVEPQTETVNAPPSRTGSIIHKTKKLLRLPMKIISSAQKKGIKRSAKLALSIAKTQIVNRSRRGRQYIFISHPVNNTGAPLVLLKIVEEYAAKYGAANVRLIAPMIEPHYLRRMHELGVKVEKAAAAFGLRMIDMQLGLRKDDFVLMNTVAIHDNYRDYIMHALGTYKLSHAYWFIHEDKDQLPAVKPDFLQPKRLQLYHDLIEEHRLTMLTPSKRTKKEYDHILNTRSVRAVPLVVSVPKKYTRPRPASDYKAGNFLISGTPSDGRKGQLMAIAAFYDFMQRYQTKNPKQYRDFSLTLLGIGNDYISQQVRWMGKSLLGKQCRIYDSIPLDEALKIYAKCNVVVCCSLNETFGLYIAEAMLMGHAVLRNNSAGVDEQLADRKNGYLIDHTNIHHFADRIEKILNKKTNSDESLRKMGEVSQKMMQAFVRHTYLEKIEPSQERT